MKDWIILLLAGVFEVCWTVALKYSHGFTRPLPAAVTLVTLALSMFLLGWAVKTLPLGTAYAVWTGIGAVGTAVLGMILFHEPVAAARIVCLALIAAGIVGLRLFAAK